MSRVAFVTGGAGGIGAATARVFLDRGDAVVIADLDGPRGTALAAQLGERAMFIEVNVSDRAGWERARCAATERFGAPDILVNNAGMFRDRSLLKMVDADWDAVIDVNLKGAWLGMQTLLPAMKAAGWGRIVNVSSSAHRGSFGQANYAAAKGGLVSLTRTVAIEALKAGVLVNAVAPHNVDTAILTAVPEHIRAEWLAKSRSGRFLQPDEVARVIAFLASDANSAMTGQLLEIDGGDLVGLP